MSLRSVATLAILILLQVSGCTNASRPSQPPVNDLERNHDEMMRRMGGSGM